MIDVMDNLTWLQRSSKHLFGSNPMFVFPFLGSIHLDNAIYGTSCIV